MPSKIEIGDLLPIVVPLARLITDLLKRAAQSGALTDEQRRELGDAAEELFAAAAEAPPPPPAKYPDGGEV